MPAAPPIPGTTRRPRPHKQRTYAAKLEKVLPAAKVARYIQIENKIRSAIKYELAAKISLVM